MSYITLDIPPGIYRTGTDYKSKGRYFNANLWRWFAGETRPVGGWVRRSLTAVTGKARAIITWRDNSAKSWCVVGTESHLYAMTVGGTLYDITPTGFTSGYADSSSVSGYGSGVYGAGIYGYGLPSGTTVLPASVWSVDTFGENWLGVMSPDSKIYKWSLDTGVVAAAVSGAPTADAIVVTAERIVMALGAAGDPRLVMNSDLQDETIWTPTVTNYARSFPLQTVGSLQCGRKVTGGTLLLTDVDAWLATFLGQPLVYGYTKVGSQCGIVSRGAIATTDVSAYWMSSNGFWVYNGYCQPVACEVSDYVFSDINTAQFAKVTAIHNSSFGEVTWRYCSAASTEIDSYVTFNYRENHWSIGKMTRLSGVDKGAFGYVLEVDDSGVVWDHERGFDHGGLVPFAETGPVDIGSGDQTYMVRKIVPDLGNLGNVAVRFETRLYPMGAATEIGPISLTENTDVRFSARQVSMSFVAADGFDFRIGNFRAEAVTRGLR